MRQCARIRGTKSGSSRSLAMCLLARVLLMIAVAVALLPASAEARRVALVIGNGNYRYATALSNTLSDANAIGAALERMRFDKVMMLTELDIESMRKALLAFEAEANGADIALVYFAGHGIEVDG